MLTDGLADAVPFERVDAGAWEDIWVVGDVHGCRREFETLLDAVGDGDSLVVVVGDLVRKGPDSGRVLDIVRERENVVSVRGNNEQKIVDGRADIGLDDEQEAFVADLPVAIGWEGNLVVHGGVDPGRPWNEHTAGDVLAMRSPNGDGYRGPFWYEQYEGDPRVFFGHTVHEAPVQREWAVGLDTGCVYGGALTAYDTGRERFVSVPAERAYVEREQWATPAPADRGRARPVAVTR